MPWNTPGSTLLKAWTDKRNIVSQNLLYSIWWAEKQKNSKISWKQVRKSKNLPCAALERTWLRTLRKLTVGFWTGAIFETSCTIVKPLSSLSYHIFSNRTSYPIRQIFLNWFLQESYHLYHLENSWCTSISRHPRLFLKDQNILRHP